MHLKRREDTRFSPFSFRDVFLIHQVVAISS
jgi:hypothetical protein